MSAPSLKRQQQGWSTIDRIFGDAENFWVVHYSCESFYDRPEGRSPRITSIAVKKFDSGQTVSFSIHQVAERLHVLFGGITNRYDELERQMLDEFFGHVGTHRGMQYLHWNMRDISYGFAALEHRHRVLGGDPFTIDDQHKFDLAKLLIDIYGAGYSGHPRLVNISQIKRIAPLNFLTGPQEAEAFETQNYVGLHQSTLRKVDVIANIAAHVFDRNLRTNTSWWEMHGGRVRALVSWAVEHKAITFIASLASIGGAVLTIVLAPLVPAMPPPRGRRAE